MKALFFTVGFLLALNAFALESLKIQPGRYIAYENGIHNLNQPVFILLPGINRGLDDRDEVIQMARKQKLNFISFHFSLHPESVVLIPNAEVAYFTTHNYTKEDLVDETKALIESLGIKKPVITALSYSSLVGHEFYKQGYSPVIQVAPMAKYSEANEAQYKIVDYWKNLYRMNPFNGAALARSYLKSTYITQWTQQANELVSSDERFQGLGTSFRLAQAYSELSVIADDFNLNEDVVTAPGKLYFVLADGEDEPRASYQQEIIENLSSQNKGKIRQITIKDSNHIIPSAAPQAYIKALKSIVAK